MNRTIVTSMLITACCLSAHQADAQDTLVVITRPAIIITDNEQSSDSEVIRRMYEQNGRHFQDPRAPRFLFVDRTGKVALGIGGYVKGTMSADMGGISNTGFDLLQIDEAGHATMQLWNYTDHLTEDLYNEADYATDFDRVAADCCEGGLLPL